MNKEEFIGKLQMVYVGDKRATEEIISEYDRLNNKVLELENINEKIGLALDSAENKVDRLNNIINELEKDLNEAYDELHRGELVNGRELINNIYQELKELKENNK